MDKIIISPSKYIQGKNAIERLGEYCEIYGKNGLVVAEGFILDMLEEKLNKTFEGYSLIVEKFNQECCKTEIDRIVEIVKVNNVDFIVGLGGGKTLDTAKAVGYYSDIKTVICPTAASSDAPTSALSVIYTEEGEFESYLMLKHNPNIVLVDLDVIANAPKRLLIAGIGDALSTYFEARACKNSDATTMAGGTATLAAVSIARLCYDTLLSNAHIAISSCENKQVTKALANVVEANVYLSGIGFESSGLAMAHAVHNGLTTMESLHSALHGEKVAFGVIVQLILENDLESLRDVLKFNTSIGLPVCLEDLGAKSYTDEELEMVSEATCKEDETSYNMPFEITKDTVKSAIIMADILGKEFKKENFL